jgi:hypothetical protein
MKHGDDRFRAETNPGTDSKYVFSKGPETTHSGSRQFIQYLPFMRRFHNIPAPVQPVSIIDAMSASIIITA